MLAANCVTEWAGNHLVLTDGDAIITDGNSVTSIADRRTRRAMFSEISQDNYKNSFVTHNASQNEIWFCYPEEGATYATRALVWDANSGRAQLKDLINAYGGLSNRSLLLSGSGTAHATTGNVSVAASSDSWNYEAVLQWDSESALEWGSTAVIDANDGMVSADPDGTGSLVHFDIGPTIPDGDLVAVLRRDSLDFGDQYVFKLVTAVWPRLTGVVGDVVNVRVGSQDRINDQISWSQFEPFRIGIDEKIDTFSTGRFISFELQSTDGGVWRCTGLDVAIEVQGRYG